MKKPDKIEELFKEAFKDYSVKPDPSLWAKIHSNIPTTSGGSGFSAAAGNASIITKAVIGIAVVSGIGISAYYLSESYSTEETTKPQPSQSEKIIPSTSENDEENNSMTLDITADTVEHLSNQVEEEKIKEIEKVLAEPTKTTDKKHATTDAESNKKSVSSEKIKEEVEDKNEDLNTETKNTNKIGGQSGQSVEQKVSDSEVNTVDEITGTSNSDDVNQDQNTSSTEPKDVISTEPKEEESKIEVTIPNVFTPNRDGYNDVFRIDTKDTEDVKVTVFDKNGKVLFEWQGLYGFWDGTLPNGEIAPSGSYFYQVLLVKDGKTETRKGVVSLMR